MHSDNHFPTYMRAAISHAYGSSDNILIEEVPVPSPGKGQVLVKVIAAGLNAADRLVLQGKPRMVRLAYGIIRPRQPIIGQDYAGIVVSIGPGCERLKPSDRVFGQGAGGLAEYAASKEKDLQVIPDGVTFIDAAALPIAGTTALQANDAGRVNAGDRVLVNGGSGGVGSYVVQIAAFRGADVTASCSPGNADTVRGFGASTILDYRQDTLLDSDRPYDAIIDCAGTLSLRASVQSTVPDGKVVRVGFAGGDWVGPLVQMAAVPLVNIGAAGSINVLAGVTSLESLSEIATLVESGDITPYIENVYELDDVRAAFQRLESKHTVGKLVVRVAPDPA